MKVRNYGDAVGMPPPGVVPRGEAVFPDAATYDPRRAPNRHIAFGVGIHF